MELALWMFGGLALLVALLIGAAAYVVFRKDKDAPNQGLSKKPRPAWKSKSNPNRGVPKSR